MKRIALLVSTAVLIPVLACDGTLALTRVPAAEAQAFAEQVEGMVEDTLQGYNDHDYAAYTQHFDEAMHEASTEETFESVYTLLHDRLGSYESRELDYAFDQNEFRIVIYRAEFEHESGVIIRAVFWRDDPERGISGLWFDSERLRADQ